MSSPEASPHILCAGIAVHDHVFRLDRFPLPGQKKRAKSFAAVGGGCAANAAVAVARLGGRASLAAPLGGPAGDDAIGDRILADLAREGVACDGVVRADRGSSPLSAILVDESGERMIVNHRDERLSALRPRDPQGLVAGADVVLVDNRFAGFVTPICEAARQRGIPVLLDGDRPALASGRLFDAVSHVVFAADGLRATAGQTDLEEALRTMAARTPAFLAVTDGARGVLWLEGGELRKLPACDIDAVDTTGAGDVFHGAFALALAGKSTTVAAMRFSTAAAAIKCSRFGGVAGAPTRAEVDALLAGRPGS